MPSTLILGNCGNGAVLRTCMPEYFNALKEEANKIYATRTGTFYFHSRTHFLSTSFHSPSLQGRGVKECSSFMISLHSGRTSDPVLTVQ
jgi:hypothetical protein